MKIIFVALLFVALSSTMAGPGYVKLSTNTINNSRLIRDLRQLGAESTLQQGIFRSTKAPLKNGDWYVDRTESVYRRIAGAVTYYKYTVILKSNTPPVAVRATYIVSFRPANGNTVVTFYHYRILSDTGVVTIDMPHLIDTRSIANDTFLSEKLQDGYDYTVIDAIARGRIQDADYHLGKIFSANASGLIYPYVVSFLVTLVTEDGYTYRARISVPNVEDVPEDEANPYPITYVIYPNK